MKTQISDQMHKIGNQKCKIDNLYYLITHRSLISLTSLGNQTCTALGDQMILHVDQLTVLSGWLGIP